FTHVLFVAVGRPLHAARSRDGFADRARPRRPRGPGDRRGGRTLSRGLGVCLTPPNRSASACVLELRHDGCVPEPTLREPRKPLRTALASGIYPNSGRAV